MKWNLKPRFHTKLIYCYLPKYVLNQNMNAPILPIQANKTMR